MARVVVARASEVPPGSMKVVEVQGRSIGLFNFAGKYFAIRNRCPHQGAALCDGQRVGFVRSERPGHYEVCREGEIIRCPWHGWEFDARTGQSWFDPKAVRVKSYDVEVVGSRELAPPAPGLEPGPYVAETYPVSRDEDMLVIEVG